MHITVMSLPYCLLPSRSIAAFAAYLKWSVSKYHALFLSNIYYLLRGHGNPKAFDEGILAAVEISIDGFPRGQGLGIN